MLNESRIKLMTKMASYEANEGKKSMAIGTYFRGDYIGKEVIKSIVYGTIAFLVCFVVYISHDFEMYMQEIYKMDLLDFGKSVLTVYVKFIVVYSVITYIVYSVRYKRARKSLRMYYNNLRRLSFMLKKEQEQNQENKENRKR